MLRKLHAKNLVHKSNDIKKNNTPKVFLKNLNHRSPSEKKRLLQCSKTKSSVSLKKPNLKKNPSALHMLGEIISKYKN